jgi:hypothetical protein
VNATGKSLLVTAIDTWFVIVPIFIRVFLTKDCHVCVQEARLSREPSLLSVMDPEVLERVHLRNELAAAKRAALLSAKEQRMQQRQVAQKQMLEQVQASKPDVARDPKRLVALTAAAKARAGASGAGELQPKESGFILQVGHKLTPAWLRQ